MRAALLWVWLLPLVFCGCQPQPSDRAAGESAAAPSAHTWPAHDYTQPPAAGQRAYRLDSAGSLLDIVVRRDGPLARFGHDHAVSVQGLEGYLLLDAGGAGSIADLRFRVEDLAVDSAAGRARYGLDTEPDAEDVEGTRSNLMEHVLNADQWPFAEIRLEDFSHRQDHYSAVLEISINGARYSGPQPFRLQASDAEVVVEGSLVLRQTDLGLVPFSALGGGLRVADPLEIHFRLAGTRLADQGSPTGMR